MGLQQPLDIIQYSKTGISYLIEILILELLLYKIFIQYVVFSVEQNTAYCAYCLLSNNSVILYALCRKPRRKTTTQYYLADLLADNSSTCISPIRVNVDWLWMDMDILGLATDPHGLTRTKNAFANAKKLKGYGWIVISSTFLID